MKLVVGLGNPEYKYNTTKHNFGFWIIDALLSKGSLKLKEGKGNYLLSKSFNRLDISLASSTANIPTVWYPQSTC